MAQAPAWARFARATVASGAVAPALQAVAARVYSVHHAYGLRRDLHEQHTTPLARVPLTLRPLEERDVACVLDVRADVGVAERWDRQVRHGLLVRGIGSPYVAADADDTACYVQWLFGHRDNDVVQSYFDGAFPVLARDEALLEGAFTPAAHRGKRIMSAGTSLLAEEARGLGARFVVTFVALDNGPSLKGCARAGFVPYTRRTERVRLDRRRTTFRDLSPAEARAAAQVATGAQRAAGPHAPAA